MCQTLDFEIFCSTVSQKKYYFIQLFQKYKEKTAWLFSLVCKFFSFHSSIYLENTFALSMTNWQLFFVKSDWFWRFLSSLKFISCCLIYFSELFTLYDVASLSYTRILHRWDYLFNQQCHKISSAFTDSKWFLTALVTFLIDLHQKFFKHNGNTVHIRSIHEEAITSYICYQNTPKTSFWKIKMCNVGNWLM